MGKITLEFDVEKIPGYFDHDTGYTEIDSIESAIIASAAVHILDGKARSIDEKITKEIDRIINETVAERVAEKVDAMVVEAFTDEYPELNSYGKPTGETTSIQAKAMSMIDRIMNESVDYRGNRNTDTYGRRGDKARWEWHLEELLTKQIDRELKRHIEGVVDDAKAAAQQRIAKQLLALGE